MIQRGLIIAGLLLVLFAGGGVMPVRAESGSDYTRAVTPDVPAATAFLRETMGCDVLDANGDRALLECGQGSVVEVVKGAPQAGARPALRLRTDDVDATLGWLQQRHVPLVAGRETGTVDPDGLLHIEVRTPWGQPLELIGRGTPRPGMSAPLAAE
ncbi:MAG: hypothetical protein B7X39_13280 [Lysobacterales bacterium 14-68-21]|nr:MAG: hypothetical protein B7X45_12170 [Xanthomonadales bacterium 15-68-25]OZB65244.1 MAG: hypothetical protein B7X39_13280 [Xanthomonadales bacterium 14-68-21]